MVKILVFDTETTGIGPIFKSESLTYAEKNDIDKSLVDKDTNLSLGLWEKWYKLWPHITQLSYIVYNTECPSESKIFNKYIDLEETVEIEKGASDVTHIYTTEEDAIRKGVDLNATNVYILSRIKKIKPTDVIPLNEAITEFMLDFNQCQYIVGHNVDFDKKMVAWT